MMLGTKLYSYVNFHLKWNYLVINVHDKIMSHIHIVDIILNIFNKIYLRIVIFWGMKYCWNMSRVCENSIKGDVSDYILRI